MRKLIAAIATIAATAAVVLALSATTSSGKTIHDDGLRYISGR